MVLKHVIIVANGENGLDEHPLKEWLRSHPEHLPQGMNTTDNTSHELRAGLKKLGWKMEQTDTQVRLLMPQIVSDFSARSISKVEEVLEDEGVLPVFSLEYQLRDFLAGNLSTVLVNGKKLRVFVDEAGRDGVEFPTDVGFIDILAIDDKGAFYVFELKRGRSPDYVIGQLARYMGWVKQTIGRNADVFGVIVSKQISSNLRYAVSVVPNVHLFEYEISFQLNPAHDLSL